MGRKRVETRWRDSMLETIVQESGIKGECVVVKVGNNCLVAKSMDDIKIMFRNEFGDFSWLIQQPSCKFCGETKEVVSAGHPGRKIDGKMVEVHQFYCKKCDKHFYIIPNILNAIAAPDF